MKKEKAIKDAVEDIVNAPPREKSWCVWGHFDCVLAPETKNGDECPHRMECAQEED